MGKGQVKKIYTEEFKRSSAELVLTTGDSIRQISEELGVSKSGLRMWVKQYSPSIMNTGSELESTKIAEELKKLRKENARLRQERDILKKATAYFAKETS